MGWLDSLGSGLKSAYGSASGFVNNIPHGLASAFGVGSGDPSDYDRSQIEGNANQANTLGTQGQSNYGVAQKGMQSAADQLMQIANGNFNPSAQQFQNQTQTLQAMQDSQAAGASPSNAAAAAFNAARNKAQLGYGVSGQVAQQGAQDRATAMSQLAQLYGNMGQLGVNAATGGYGAANAGYGSALANPQKTFGGMLGGALGGLAAAAVKSDRRAKTSVRDADADSASILDGLKSYTYKYKSKRDGAGKQYGVMAQDLERAGLEHAVIDTPRGKYVDAGKAATSSLALVAALGRRVSKLEDKGK